MSVACELGSVVRSLVWEATGSGMRMDMEMEMALNFLKTGTLVIIEV
jgi:hypothetical protein